jgi:hypothetical protein
MGNILKALKKRKQRIEQGDTEAQREGHKVFRAELGMEPKKSDPLIDQIPEADGDPYRTALRKAEKKNRKRR